MDPEKVAAVSKMKNPRIIKELRAILGLVGFYRRFIQGFGKIAELLYKLYKLLNKKIVFLGSKRVNQQLNNLNKHYRKHQFWVIRMTRNPIR